MWWIFIVVGLAALGVFIWNQKKLNERFDGLESEDEPLDVQ